MIKIETISVVIIAKNAQKTLDALLQSLEAFSDVVLYSNNSTDATEAIAKSYSNVHLVVGDFVGFGPTKNKAASYAKNEWILSLDADEVLTSAFVNNLQNLELQRESVYTILRTNYYKDREIKHCWGNDTIVRLYNRSVTSFSNDKVHEKIVTAQLTIYPIEGVVHHYPYASVSEFIMKLDRYSTIFANDNVGKKSASPLKAILNGFYSFFKTYFLKKGFLDGYAGLVIAFSHMATNFYKYIKLYELNQSFKS